MEGSAKISDRQQDRLMEAWRLGVMLVTAAERAKLGFGETSEALGLPVPLARALIMLDEPVPMGELAELLACDPSYVTALADQLEERGLAERTLHYDDRRVRLLTLTAEGRALRDQIGVAVATEGMMLTRLTDAERAVLSPLLEKLVG